MKSVIVICLAVCVVIVFGASCDTTGLATKTLRYAEYIGDNIEVPSLLGGHSFDKGFAEGSLAVLYIVSLPLRFAWCVMQFVYYSVTFWGVTI